MTKAIHKVLCSLNGMMGSLHQQWAKELMQVDSSVKSITVDPNENIPQLIAGRNAKRVEIWIHNAGNKDLFLAPFNGNITRQVYSIRIALKDTLVLNSHNFAHMYKKDIYGFWEDGVALDSRANITEFFITS